MAGTAAAPLSAASWDDPALAGWSGRICPAGGPGGEPVGRFPGDADAETCPAAVWVYVYRNAPTVGIGGYRPTTAILIVTGEMGLPRRVLMV